VTAAAAPLTGIDDIHRFTLAEMKLDLGFPWSRWLNGCGLIAPAAARHHQLEVRLLGLTNDGSGCQEFHVMLITPDGQRVVDLLECQARYGRDPDECGDWRPFVGTKAEWGQALPAMQDNPCYPAFDPFARSGGKLDMRMRVVIAGLLVLSALAGVAAAAVARAQDAPYETVTLTEQFGGPQSLNCYWHSWDDNVVTVTYAAGNQVILPGNHGWLLCSANP
jgi:hypothetical protein